MKGFSQKNTNIWLFFGVFHKKSRPEEGGYIEI